VNDYVRTRVHVEGLRQITEALSDLPRAAAKKILQRATMAAMEPMRAEAQRLAPVDAAKGNLKRSIIISTKRSTSRNRKYQSDLNSSVTVYMGPGIRVGAYPEAVIQEFGSKPHIIRPRGTATKGQRLKAKRSGVISRPYLMIKLPSGSWIRAKEIRHPGNRPHPYMRPAYDMHALTCVGEIGEKVGAEVMAYAARAAKRQARRNLKIG
jgi:HK97 gp10 family phage protein